MAHHEQDHPYHLVDPSPWPVVGSAALLLLTLGAAMSMHSITGGPALLVAGFGLVLFTMYVWWRDVVREAHIDKVHTSAVRHGLRMGMALFILSEVMFFFAFFWAFFNASIYPVLPLEELWPATESGIWPPAGITPLETWDLPFINTLILLLSGTTVTWAHHALLHGDRKGLIQGLWVTVLLGISFTALQAYEYGHAMFGFTDGIFASTFYMATGFHGLHVLIGTIFLAVQLVRAHKNQLTTEHHLGFEFAAWYWHFVDAVWLFLFVFVYWWGGA